MSENVYNLIYTGEFAKDKNPEDVYINLSKEFKTDPDKIRKLFNSKRKIIKKNAGKETCIKLKDKVLSAGACCEIQKSENHPVLEAYYQEESYDQNKSSSDYNSSDSVYEDEKKTQYSYDKNDVFPEKRPGSNGIAWLTDAFYLYLKDPLMWVLTMLLYFLISIGGQLVPILGGIVMTILGPVFYGGLLMGINELDEYGELRPGSIFYGFRENMGQLVLLGLFLVGCFILIAGAVFTIIFSFFGTAALSAFNPNFSAIPPFVFILFPLLITALIIPMTMLYWFAPALVSINNISAGQALKLSFQGCLKNIAPFLIYSLIIAGIGIAGIICITAAAGLITVFFNSSIFSAFLVPLLFILVILFVFVPVAAASVYTSYKDIFE
ncbi:MAG: BPSS1780 family membrane protein [Thermodesulfobacteriota bacterium]